MNYVSIFLILAGSLLCFTSAIGVVRFPDTLTRMHAATKPQTLGLILTCAGAGIRLRHNLDSGMLILVALFALITSPVIAHLAGRLAFREIQEEEEQRKQESSADPQ